MAFPKEVKEQALVECARHCCICHRFCGIKIELHHIKHASEGGPDTYENCIPLCFDCHGDMRSYDHKHPKGSKYSESELKRHRDSWYERVKATPVTGYSADSEGLDRSVFDELRSIVPWNGTISFLRTNNFAGFSFRLNKLDNLREFLDRCDDPTFEFIDIELESLRATFEGHADSLLSTLALNTFTSGNNLEFASVPQEWEIDCPERFDEVVGSIHSLAKSVVETYDQLLRTARRKLGRADR